MTRIDSARAAAGSARESMRHAAEVVTPYAETARDAASHYAHEAGARLGPKVSSAARQARRTARDNYDVHVVPRIAQARGALPHEVDEAACRAAEHTRRAARQAGAYAKPRVEQVRAAAGPAREEAVVRSAAAVAAMRHHVTARDIEKLAKRRRRRARNGRVAKRLGLLGILAGAGYAAWRWWDRQANPDWLVEPPAATEVDDRTTLSSVDGTGDRDRLLDPEVEAKQAESDQEPGEGR
ncbi:DUF5324 family protein [Streptomyces sp. JJ36]|uniref:DUF5324 family protein n=1 Tax=Streptomyces sp. JJ36 TaxID=2736645 RepID=UPI001F373BB5|nr:DUF5324 family protein [Streptomyces sp. JJ36]MCF6526334.1 DUF5324 family protein [Streptomyces sp. JJ36]